MATAQSTSKGPVRRTFQSETPNQRWQLADARKRASGAPEHTSENVKSHNFSQSTQRSSVCVC